LGTVLQDTNKTRLRITPLIRYSFEREKTSGYLNLMAGNRKWRVDLEGGRYVQQFNAENPILPLVNTFTTLLLERNLMKIYEHDFGLVRLRKNINPKWTLTSSWMLEERTQLQNTTNFKIVNREGIEGYTPNEPFNLELPATDFPKHRAFTGSFGISAKPWMKFRSHNGHKFPVTGSSPVIALNYKKGFNKIFGSDIKYDQLEGSVRYGFDLLAKGSIDFSLLGGVFLNNDKMYFMDYKHFLGNQTPIITSDPVGSFRLLDYYRHSTSRQYFVGTVQYTFRKFMLTSMPYVRLAGIRENIFVSYLKTPHSRNYTEVGYSIDGILRMFRLEAAAAFENGKYVDYGFRIGVASNIAVNFSD
jgi:hypothetical protein